MLGTWPSEELLAYYLIQEHERLIKKGASVIELGAGQSGLAGFALSAIRDDLSLIEITDGNTQCVKCKILIILSILTFSPENSSRKQQDKFEIAQYLSFRVNLVLDSDGKTDTRLHSYIRLVRITSFFTLITVSSSSIIIPILYKPWPISLTQALSYISWPRNADRHRRIFLI